jgi:hypothetical protein
MASPPSLSYTQRSTVAHRNLGDCAQAIGVNSRHKTEGSPVRRTFRRDAFLRRS